MSAIIYLFFFKKERIWDFIIPISDVWLVPHSWSSSDRFGCTLLRLDVHISTVWSIRFSYILQKGFCHQPDRRPFYPISLWRKTTHNYQYSDADLRKLVRWRGMYRLNCSFQELAAPWRIIAGVTQLQINYSHICLATCQVQVLHSTIIHIIS